MPIKIGDKTFAKFKDAEEYIKSTQPDISDAAAYVASIEQKQEGIEVNDVIDPRGPGSVDHLEQMRGGQPNIIDYSNQEPLLFGLGEDSSHDYPGKIVVNNEPKRALEEFDFEVKKKTIPGPAETGVGSVGNNMTQPGLPTGGVEIDHNAHGMNFNDKIRWNESKIELNEAFVEQEHPRAAAGTSTGGQFVSSDGEEGDDLESRLQYKTTIQGKEVDVNLRQKKTWEKHTSEEQRNDPNFTTRYGDELTTQGQGEKKPEGPTPTKKPSAFIDVTPEDEPTVTAAPNKDLYKNIPADTDKAGEGRKLRKKQFEEYEEDNGKLYELKDTIKIQQGQIKYQNDQIAERGGTEEPKVTEHRRENIKALEESIQEKTLQADNIENGLLKNGKLEYEEIQKHLHQRQFYVDDLERRKTGSTAWYKAQGQVFAHDRVIDDYRTGKITGHFPGAEMEKHKANIKAAQADVVTIAKKEREEKNKVKYKKMTTENDAAIQRLKSKGFDVDPTTGKFREPPDPTKYDLPTNRPSPEVDTIKDHQEYQKQYKSALENNVDILTLRVNIDEKNHGWSSDYDRKALKAAKWQSKNLVDDHKMIGVTMFNDSDSNLSAIYEKKFNESPMLGQLETETIEIHKGAGPKKGYFQKSSTVMGSWNRKGRVSLFFTSKKSRAKLESMGMTREDFNLTGDHEFGHASWHGAKNYIDETGDEIPLAKAMKSLSNDVSVAYTNKDFKIDPYTDTYRNQGGLYSSRGADILENEVHSKLREFEVAGKLDTMELKLTQSQQLVDRHGAPTTELGLRQVENDKNFLTVIKSYKNLRKEMYAI